MSQPRGYERVTFTFQLEPRLRRALESRAAAEERSMAYYVTKYLEEGLRKDGYWSTDDPHS